MIFPRIRVGSGEGVVECFCHHQRVARVLVVVALGCLPRLPESVDSMRIIESLYEEHVGAELLSEVVKHEQLVGSVAFVFF